jgi:hypothetical protein
MTATPPTPPESKSSSRRAVLAGALGGLGALAASAIGRANPVRAGSDGDVVLGAGNTTTGITTIQNTATNGTGFVALGSGSGIGVEGLSTSGYAVYGASTSGYAVYGDSTSGIGVYPTSSSGVGVNGVSDSSDGVQGQSTSHSGVAGISAATNFPAIGSWSQGNSTGVEGYSGAALPPAAKAKTGVYGYAAQDNFSRG